MITSWMARYENMSIAKAIDTFAAFRPKGIYKENYVLRLYSYYHEIRCLTSAKKGNPETELEAEMQLQCMTHCYIVSQPLSYISQARLHSL